MIQAKHITKQFKRLKALDDVSFEWKANQVVSLIGPNGSGKTTLIKCLLGMVRPDQGEIEVMGKSIRKNDAYREHIGYMPQIGRYPDHMKVGQLFDLLCELRNLPEEKLDKDLLEIFQLKRMHHQSMRTLSGGTRQKVSAAIAFLFNPSIYILDEPTAGLDPLSAERLKEKIKAVKELGKLILITSHVLSDFDDLTTDVLYLQEGKIRYCNSLEALKSFTGEQKFGKAIARIMEEHSA